MKILVIGSGAREHCLVWKISQSKEADKIFAIPGNAGIAQVAQCENIPLSRENFKNILHFIKENEIDFTVVGPEAPLVDGIVDFLSENGCLAFGPDKESAQIEGSKVFTKRLCSKYGIPTANAAFFNKSEYNDAVAYINSLNNEKFPYVIKADGLAAGKGVIIAKSKTELLGGLKEFFVENIFGASGENIIIEDFISGFEVSLLCLCDGDTLIPLDMAQDYKKIFDGDFGKNTGGMGSYSPLPFIDEVLYKKIMDKIIFPTFNALKKEGFIYKGVLYGGIIVRDNEPFLLEYNCRFGDPETQAIIPRLKSDIIPILMSCALGTLKNIKLEWTEDKSVCVVIASKGYPQSSSDGDIIYGLEKIKNSPNIFVFHAGTKNENSEIATNGGRVLSMVSIGKSFKDARKMVYNSIEKISFDGMQFRKDIALKVEEF
ncbi:MAG: phosphoribosylamine--glycine ligase [Actinobacteria bacterium]|nr:phosphoribosylamine--glycine ligase [Actinomycetota bacterium]